jgi:Protein of unknown function (DUF3558).
MNVYRIALLVSALVGLALALAACGGDDSAGGTATPTATQKPPTGTPLVAGTTPGIDECSLVTPAEVNQIIPGQAFPAGVEAQDFCKFTSTADLVSIGTADLATPEAAAQTLQDSVNRTTSVKVDGVGDAAYWQTKNNQLAITIGRLAMVVDVFSNSGDQANSSAATAIARIAIGRLPS